MGVGSGGQGGRGPPGFSYMVFSPPRKRLNSAIFGIFLLFFDLFFRWTPLENFLPTLLGPESPSPQSNVTSHLLRTNNEQDSDSYAEYVYNALL